MRIRLDKLLADTGRWSRSEARELIRAGVTGESIAEIAVYCTGDWNAARQAEHQRAVRLLRT